MKIVLTIALLLLFSCITAKKKSKRSRSTNYDEVNINSEENIEVLLANPYKIGKQFDRSKINTLVSIIYSAASLYRHEHKNSLRYIHKAMSFHIGKDSLLGFAIQDNDTVWTAVTHELYSKNNENYIIFDTQTSWINPRWSYYAFIVPKQNRSLQAIMDYGMGKGMNITTANEILQILTIRKEDTCQCGNIHQSGPRMNERFGKEWTIICHTAPLNIAIVPVSNSQWLRTYDGICHYIVFAS